MMDIKDYFLVKLIGRGGFGKVMLVQKKTGKDQGETQVSDRLGGKREKGEVLVEFW